MSEGVLLDLFGGEGEAAAGYAAAGWTVKSVELVPARARRNPWSWYVGDWAAGLERALTELHVLAVHASPPCQAYTRAGHLGRAQGRVVGRVDLVADVRAALDATGLPYVIENVEGAPLHLTRCVRLCGSEFGLQVQRHRLFEHSAGVFLMGAGGCQHGLFEDGRPWGVYGRAGDTIPSGGRTALNVAHGVRLLGVPHRMTWRGVTDAIPPAYTRHIGEQLADQLGGAA